MLSLPNILTLSRIVALPFLVALLWWPGWTTGYLFAFVLYAVMALTDYFDGYLARKLNQISPFGTFLDPISDKISVGALLVLLVEFDRLQGLWILPVILILTREFLISGLREFLGPQNVQLPVTQLAKWKTAIQMVALGLLILGPIVPLALELGQWGLLLAAVITVMTGWGYMKAGLEVMRKMP